MGLVNERELMDLATMGKAWLDNAHVPGCDACCDADPSGLTLDGDLIYSTCSPSMEFRHMVERLMEKHAAEEVADSESERA